MKIETYAETYRKIRYDAEAYKRVHRVLAKMPALVVEMKQKKILSPPLRTLLEQRLTLQTDSPKMPAYAIRSPSGYPRRISADLSYAARSSVQPALSRST